MKYLFQVFFMLVFTSQFLISQNFRHDTTGLWHFASDKATQHYPNTLKYWNAFEERAEVAWHERKTKNFILHHFKKLQKKYGQSIVSIDTIAGGVYVEIEGNPQSEYTLFIRPEMDALAYAATDSTPAEVKHSCAHSVGLGVACSLAEVILSNQSFHWKKVCFLFTASEEATPSGTRKMLEVLQKRGLSKYGKIVALGQHMSVDDVDNN